MSFPDGIPDGGFLDSDFMFIGGLGMWVGSVVGAMAQVVPFQLVMLLTMVVGVLAWLPSKPTMAEVLITAGVGSGAIFGTFSHQMPWGVAVFSFMVMAVLVIKQFGQLGGISNLIIVPIFVVVSAGLFYDFTYPAFCLPNGITDVCANPANWIGGVPTGYIGCTFSCGFSAFTIFGSSPLYAFLATGDVLAFILYFFTSTSGVLTLFGIVIGSIMLFLGTGMGVTVSANTILGGLGGGASSNEAGTQMAQSLGIGFIVFSALFFSFGAMFQAFGPTFTFMGVIGLGLEVMLAMVMVYGFYLQGKNQL